MCAKSEIQEKRWRKSSGSDFSSPFPPARLFCGCLSAIPELLTQIKPRLEQLAGEVRAQSEIFDFPETRAYARAMGHGLKRQFYVFAPLVPQDCLGRVKTQTCALEDEIARAQEWPMARPLNLDPGLLTEQRIVLASTKDRGHRLPREEGIYEEITLLFFDGAFQPLMWTYADWRSPHYRQFFEQERKTFLDETRSLRKEFRERARTRRF